MSRNQEYDNYEYCNLAEGPYKRALKGKRGQQLLKDLLAALDALPEKKLAPDVFDDNNGNFCALGALANHKGLDIDYLKGVEPDDIPYLRMSKTFDAAPTLLSAIVDVNDDDGIKRSATRLAVGEDTLRFNKTRRWVESNITKELK